MTCSCDYVSSSDIIRWSFVRLLQLRTVVKQQWEKFPCNQKTTTMWLTVRFAVKKVIINIRSYDKAPSAYFPNGVHEAA